MKTKRLLRNALLTAAVVLFVCAAARAQEPLRPFDATSLNGVLEQHAGKPFVLALWSIHCAPCREEMAYWKEFRQRYPNVPIVLVSTDLPEEWSDVRRFLVRYDPGPVERWAFADEYVERLRYSIDPKWRGELPRTYFYDANHVAQGRSGKIDVGWLNDWFSRHASAR